MRLDTRRGTQPRGRALSLSPASASRASTPSLPVPGILSLSLSEAAVLGSLLVPIRLLPAAVVVGQVLRVLLLPGAHVCLAVRSAAVLPRAVAADLGRRLLPAALRAALRVTRGRHRNTVGPHDHSSGYDDHAGPEVAGGECRCAGRALVPFVRRDSEPRGHTHARCHGGAAVLFGLKLDGIWGMIAETLGVETRASSCRWAATAFCGVLRLATTDHDGDLGASREVFPGAWLGPQNASWPYLLADLLLADSRRARSLPFAA